MKTPSNKKWLAALGLLLTLTPQLSTVLAQGSLTPPGAPAPTMKSLDQIESRTPISSLPYTISVPGSYYLTTNLTTAATNGIVIFANGVTLDLNGYTIFSTAPDARYGGAGILLSSGMGNITIRNGVIRGGVAYNAGLYSGSGFASGISFSGTAPANVRVSQISVSDCQYNGINLGQNNSLVESCTVWLVGSWGIYASTIKQCSADLCGSSAIRGRIVSDCYGGSVGTSNSYGIYAATAQNCYGIGQYGLLAERNALNCNGQSTGGGDGLSAQTAQNCSGRANGIYRALAATVATGCRGFNGQSGTGLEADVAVGCAAYSDSGTGVEAFIANVCRGETFTGTKVVSSHNINSY
jgi:hypothetical protein